MTRRAARVTQCEIDRALCAAEKRRARGGEAWRVRIESDGAIVLEPHVRAAGDNPPATDRPPLGKPGEAMF